MNQENREKVVVITGATGALGDALIKKFAHKRLSLLINYLHNEKKALELQQIFQKDGNDAIIFKADVSEKNDVMQMYKKCIERFGRVDVLINNAGICNDNPICLLREEQWDEVIKTNLTGVYLCSRFFSKSMISNRSGNIINIASARGILGEKGQANYVAAKGGVIALTKALAKELIIFGIDVNAICPGHIWRGIGRYGGDYSLNNMEMGSYQNNDEINLRNAANMIDFLSFDNLKGVTGNVFRLDSEIN